MPKADREYVDRIRTQVQTAYETFKERRETWDDLVRRDFPPVLDVRLGASISEYQTPDLEEAEHEFADILTMNPTRFAGNLRQQGKHAEDAMNDAVLLAAHTWAMIENRGRWIDRANAIAQTRYGVNVMRMLHTPIEEPEGEDSEEREYSRPWPFYFEQSSVTGSAWEEKNGKANVFVYEYEVPVVSAYEDYRTQGKTLNKGKSEKRYEDDQMYRPAVDQMGKLTWVGDSETIDKSVWSKNLKGVIIEYKDTERPCPICPDKHPLWCGIEILRADNQDLKDGEIIQEYVLPYKHAGSFRIIAGRTTNDRDPHYKYRPLAYRLYVEASVMNWCLSTLQTLANRDSSDARVYLNISKLSDAMVGRLNEEWWQTNFSVPLPDYGSNGIPVLPGELTVWPTALAPVLWEVYQDAMRRFTEAKPNRFLVGDNFKEAEQGTGSSNLQATQQARLPFGWLLSQSDNFILEAKEDQFHAIRYWAYDLGEKEAPEFHAALTGDEPLKKGTSESGRDVYVSGPKLDYSFDLVLKTENETLQEQIEKQKQALFLHDKGWIDAEQTVERLGFYDTEDQLRKLSKYRLQKAMAPLKLQLQTVALKTILAAVADIDPMLLMDPTMGGGMPMQGQTPPTPVPGQQNSSVRLPALEGPQGGSSAVPMMGGMG